MYIVFLGGNLVSLHTVYKLLQTKTAKSVSSIWTTRFLKMSDWKIQILISLSTDNNIHSVLGSRIFRGATAEADKKNIRNWSRKPGLFWVSRSQWTFLRRSQEPGACEHCIYYIETNTYLQQKTKIGIIF